MKKYNLTELIMKQIGISEFKAKCINELKTVQETGEPLLVTWRKRPIAMVNPYRRKRELGKLRGRITIHDDIIRSDFSGEWEMNQ